MKSGVDVSNEDKPIWPDPATTATFAGISSPEAPALPA
jgi:hypothetical protein